MAFKTGVLNMFKTVYGILNAVYIWHWSPPLHVDDGWQDTDNRPTLFKRSVLSTCQWIPTWYLSDMFKMAFPQRYRSPTSCNIVKNAFSSQELLETVSYVV